jgi:NTE family protein
MKRALILSGGGARGAFQIGVWKYLEERNWTPDLICGTSVGAINAVAIGAGMPPDRLLEIWTSYHGPMIYRFRMLKFLANLLFGRPLKPVMDTGPLRKMVSRHLDIDALRKSRIDVIISAVNLLTARLHLFNQEVIDVDHVMASSAVPVLFPWQHIDGEPYWDGGVMANSLLFPALESGADEIIVVLLSPVGNVVFPAAPGSLTNALEHVLEHFLIGSCQTVLASRGWPAVVNTGAYPSLVHGAKMAAGGQAGPIIKTVAPSRMLGFRSLFNFSVRQARRLIDEGYRNARAQLGNILSGG